MSDAVPKLLLWMTREEFLTAWAYQFVAELENAYGAEEIPAESRDALFGSVGNSLRWAAAKLQHDHGVVFSGFSINEDGLIDLKSQTPIEPRNELYLYRFALGKIPHPLGAIDTALKFLDERRATIDTEAMRVARAEVARAFQEAREQIAADPEAVAAAGDALTFLMNRAGYRRKDQKDPN